MDRAFIERKTEEAVRANIHPLVTIEDRSAEWPVRPIGNAWSRQHYDGDFHGLERISAVGGRTIATALIDQRLVQDLYLTTSPIDGGEPGTPFYCGRHSPKCSTIVRKSETRTAEPIRFEHLALV